MGKDDGSPDFLKPIWELFASVRLTVVVLFSLAATSIIGTLIPQNETPAAYVQAYGEFVYRVFYILDIFDMYHSWWFQFLLVMLAANVVVCSIDRLSSTWKIIFVKNPSFNLSRFQRQPNREKFSPGRLPNDFQNTLTGIISKRFNFHRVDENDTGYLIFAEKGRLTRLGVYSVHLSVLILLIGGVIGSLFGFEGFVNIPEGQSVDSVRLRFNGQIKPLGFSIRCDDFDVQFYDTGAPKEFRSRLTIIENGKPVFEKDIIVNDPLRYKGINIFQSSYGAMSANGATLQFKSTATGLVYAVPVTVGQPASIPENGGEILITAFREAFNFKGRNIGEIFLGKLSPKNGPSTDIVLPLRFPEFDKMRKGQWMISVSDPKYRYYTGLQVTDDPSVWIVYMGFIIMIIGCFVTFFTAHQSICIEVVSKGGRSTVWVSGIANKNKLGMDRKVQQLSGELARLAGDTAEA
jgi:cytochrome c biogenesis protein